MSEYETAAKIRSGGSTPRDPQQLKPEPPPPPPPKKERLAEQYEGELSRLRAQLAEHEEFRRRVVEAMARDLLEWDELPGRDPQGMVARSNLRARAAHYGCDAEVEARLAELREVQGE